MSTTGPWCAVRDSQQLMGHEEGRSVSPSSRLRISQLRIFSTTWRCENTAIGPRHTDEAADEKTRMLDARPRVRQEHEKAASRHCLPRRPPGSASRIISGEGAKGPPTSPCGSLVRSLSTKQTRMVSIVASGLVHSGDASLNGFRWLVKSAGPHSHFGKPSPATLVQESQSCPLEDPHDSWFRPLIGRSHRPPSLGACRDPRFQPRRRTSPFSVQFSVQSPSTVE